MARFPAKVTPPLTDPQKRAAALLAQGRLVADVAQTLEIPPGEFADWRALPGFIAAVNAKIAETRESTRQRLRALAGDALGVVEAALREETTPAKIRLDLALKVLALVGASDLAKADSGYTSPADVAEDWRHDGAMREMSRF